MKKLLALVAITLTFGTSSPARAQSSGMFLENWKDILLGPMFTGGASINAGSVVTGFKTNAEFAFAGGAMLIYPWSPQIAFDLTVCYDSRALNFHDEKNDANKYDFSYSYFALRPEFRIGGFLIGAGLGFPVGVSVTPAGSYVGVPVKLSASEMNFLVELRIGGDITISKTDAGQFHLLLGASYGFSKIMGTDFVAGNVPFFRSPDGTMNDETHNNGPMATAQIGLTYLFDLTPH